jgi:hypothetical protein
MVFTRNSRQRRDRGPAEPARGAAEADLDAATPTGDVRDYCDWMDRVVGKPADGESDTHMARAPRAEDLDAEDASWTALLAHARAQALELRNADAWDALLARLPAVRPLAATREPRRPRLGAWLRRRVAERMFWSRHRPRLRARQVRRWVLLLYEDAARPAPGSTST